MLMLIGSLQTVLSKVLYNTENTPQYDLTSTCVYGDDKQTLQKVINNESGHYKCMRWGGGAHLATHLSFIVL